MATNTTKNLWYRLTEPAASLIDLEDRRNARFLSSLLVILIPLGYLIAAVPLAFTSTYLIWKDIRFWIMNVAILLLVVIYLLSRSRNYKQAVKLATAVGTAAIILPIIVENDTALSSTSYLLVMVFFTSMFLSIKATTGLVIVCLAVTFALPVFVDGATYINLLTGPVAFLLIGSGLILFGAHHRDELEKDRRVDLMASEERYRLLFESNPLPMWVLDTEKLIFLAVNEAAVAHYGFSQEEFLAMTIKDIHPLEEQPRLDFYLSELHPLQELTGDWKHCKKDGTLIDVEIIVHNIVFLNRSARLILANDVTKRKQVEEKIQRQIEHLTALGEIDLAISSSFDLRTSLGTLLNHVIQQLGVDAADILVFGSGPNNLEYIAGRGFRTNAFKNAQLRLGEGLAGHTALERNAIYIPNLTVQHDDPRIEKHLANEGFISYHGLPLIAKGQVNGVLEVFQRARFEPDEEWLDFLNALTEQASIAIDNSKLFDSLQRSNADLTLAYNATIEGWSRALDLRDKETEGHTKRVTEMTVGLARSFGLSDAELLQVRWGALLHDIGKMGVPDYILFKPGPLTDAEWSLMKKHPIFAYEMLAPIRYLRLALDIPYYHHEWWDGTGYPLGLKGEQIPLPARIFSVVDNWDALTSDRPYRPAWPEEKVRQHIQSLAGVHFDEQVVKNCLESDVLTSQKHQ